MEVKNQDTGSNDLEKYKRRKKRAHSRAFMLKVLRDLAESNSPSFISKKYDLSRSLIRVWRGKFKEEYELYKLLLSMKEKKRLSKEKLLKENERLQQALEEALLKNRALETLIDIAEEELNVQVRKKSGPKQSKGSNT